MLGIRRYRGAAVDLFLGERRLFAADLWVEVPTPDRATLTAALTAAERSGQRHVAIAAGAMRLPADLALDVVLDYLDQRAVASAYPQRISLVVLDKEHYRTLQEALFARLPEVEP